MANYLSNKNGPLFEEEDGDIDDDTFLRRGRHNYMLGGRSNYPSAETSSGSSNEPMGIEGRRLELLQKKKEIEERSIKSTERSLSYLKSSEEMGVATAEELMRQREQLVRTEKRLDDINANLRTSQKHIQGIKSVFSGLKNLISGNKAAAQPRESFTDTSPRQESDLDQYVFPSQPQNKEMHPGLRLKEDRPRDLTEKDSQHIIDENLDTMLSTISRLSGLAQNLGAEIDTQNDIIGNIHGKVEKADFSLNKQNKELKKLTK